MGAEPHPDLAFGLCVLPCAPLSVSPLTMAYHHKMSCLAPGLSLLDEDKGKTFCLDHREIFFWLYVLNGKCIQQKSCEMRSGTYVPYSGHGYECFSICHSVCLPVSFHLSEQICSRCTHCFANSPREPVFPGAAWCAQHGCGVMFSFPGPS